MSTGKNHKNERQQLRIEFDAPLYYREKLDTTSSITRDVLSSSTNNEGLSSSTTKEGLTHKFDLSNFLTKPLLHTYTPAGFNRMVLACSAKGHYRRRKPIPSPTHKTMKVYTHKYRCMNRIKHAYPRHGRIYILLHDVHYDTVGDRLHGVRYDTVGGLGGRLRHPHKHK